MKPGDRKRVQKTKKSPESDIAKNAEGMSGAVSILCVVGHRRLYCTIKKELVSSTNMIFTRACLRLK